MEQLALPLVLAALMLLAIAVNTISSRAPGGQHALHDGCALPFAELQRQLAAEAAPTGRHRLQARGLGGAP